MQDTVKDDLCILSHLISETILTCWKEHKYFPKEEIQSLTSYRQLQVHVAIKE